MGLRRIRSMAVAGLCGAVALAAILPAARLAAQTTFGVGSGAGDISSPLPPPGRDATAVLERIRSSLIQVKMFLGANSAHTSHGTGFAVAPGGYFMTNYHVVAEVVLHPERYRLEYRSPADETGPLEVIAIDVRNDLAVVRAPAHAPAPLPLQAAVPSQGARAFSVGYPLDVGLTITEGVSNGKVPDSFNPRIHYSGALNGGMSGGPTLNADGEVIGVNVSGYLFSQLVNFVVPGAHAVRLRDRALAHGAELPPTSATLEQSLQQQLRGHSKELLAAFDRPFETQVSDGYRLPAKLVPFMECSASGRLEPEEPVQTTRIHCAANAGLHVETGLSSGDLYFVHNVLSTNRLGPWRFFNRLSKFTSAVGHYGQRKHVGPYACRDRIVALKGFDASLMTCVRAYRKLAGLFDFAVRIASMDGARTGFVSHLDMYGVDYDEGMAFLRRYVDAMEAVE